MTDALAERFALEYLTDLNATQAYLRIRPEVKPASAAVAGHRLLRDANVQAHLTDLRTQQADRLQLTSDAVLRELAACSFSDYRDYTVEDGRFGLSAQAHELAGRAISSVKHKTRKTGETVEHEVEFKLWPKVQALTVLAEHLGLIKKGDDDLPNGGREIRWRFVAE